MFHFERLSMDQYLDLVGIPFLSNGQFGTILDDGQTLSIHGKTVQKIEGLALDPHKTGGYGHRGIAFSCPDGRRHAFFGDTFVELMRVCKAIDQELARSEQLKVSYIGSGPSGIEVLACNGKSDASAEFVLPPVPLRDEYRTLAPQIAAAAAVVMLNLLPDHRLVLRTPRTNKPMFDPQSAPLCA